MNKKQQKKKKNQILSVVSLITLVVAIGLATVGLSSTVGEIDEAVVARTPEAILASTGLSEGKDVFLPVSYFDQKMDECVNLYDRAGQKALRERQFEWSECGYKNKEIERGLVDYYLGEDYLPVAKGGVLTANRGMNKMDGWFEKVEGENKEFVGSLKLEYKEEGAEFAFYKSEFYPLDGVEFSAGDVVNKDGHNHLFTMSFAVPFTVLTSGHEGFEIAADDDTFVYVGDRLVIDMGGVHGATKGRFAIRENGEVYAAVEDEDLAYSGVKVESGDGSIVRIFHADRDSTESTFKVKFTGMNLTVTDVKLAEHEEGDGVQIAYDPTDPTYVAPLGESSVVRPDGTKGFIVIATVEGVMVLVFAVLAAVVIRNMVHRKSEQKNR